MKAKSNAKKLVAQSVIGEVHSPAAATPYRVDHTGRARVLPATGGITYNVKVGDSVFGMQGDHIEPGVSIQNKERTENVALNLLACVGNEAKVVSGEAKGKKGVVTGKHGGIEHVLVYFPKDVLDELAIGDKIQVKAQGQGMLVEGFEESIHALNMDPAFFEKLGATVKDGKLQVPVAAVVPAHLMGSGIGSASAYQGDYDIMTADAEELKQNGLEKLRYGDIVLLQDCDTSYGRGFLKGAATIGIVVHSNCILMGHGPGVTTLLTAKTPVLEGVLTKSANLADYMGLK
ncbi:DUF4438 domain-containing protein [Ruminococcaceae bacterium OttesenSCG-928-O06]|nr:DUF4438 domain-containing protein [Ruminococcaceae bacterium OttesenSCG-928-O06]